MKQFRLPDGLMIVGLNRQEIGFLYDEIVVHDIYLRHGLAIPRGGVVIDAGANIGLFTLAVMRADPTVRVHAFEPVPAIHAVLAENARRHFPQAVLHAAGLGAATGIAPVAYYPRCSGWSTRYPDHRQTRADVAAFAARRGGGRARAVPTMVRRLVGRVIAAHWLRPETVACRFVTLSAVIADHGIAAIDLLKIDVERAELDVLEGIALTDWSKIAQLAIEVHDQEGRVRRIVGLLRGHGFATVVEQLAALAGSSLYMVYARR